jgi:hypothetical protein
MFERAWKFAVVVILACAAAAGTAKAQSPEVGVVYRPGDTIHVVVTFEKPIKVDSGGFYLQLQGALTPGQWGFATAFWGTQLAAISDREYEFSGPLSASVGSGKWLLQFVDVATGGVTRRYNFGTDFKEEIVLRIENPRHVEFPDLNSVTLRP